MWLEKHHTFFGVDFSRSRYLDSLAQLGSTNEEKEGYLCLHFCFGQMQYTVPFTNPMVWSTVLLLFLSSNFSFHFLTILFLIYVLFITLSNTWWCSTPCHVALHALFFIYYSDSSILTPRSLGISQRYIYI